MLFRLATLDACVMLGGCVAAAARLLPGLSVYMDSMTLIIIDKYDGVIFLYPAERARKWR